MVRSTLDINMTAMIIGGKRKMDKFEQFEQEVRLEAVKVASKVASKSAGISNVMVHAYWLSHFILTGSQPEVSNISS
jgi:hypothetical protein